MAMIYTHDHQAFDGEYLGLAIMANQADYLGQLTCPEEGPGITQTYGMEMSLRPDAAVCWSAGMASICLGRRRTGHRAVQRDIGVWAGFAPRALG